MDLIVTSPPYFGLRSYQDGGEHYAGQVGDEATPAEFLAALWSCTREWMRVLKPEGNLWVNLGDKYSQRTQTRRSSHQPGIFPGKFEEFAETWAERAAKGAVRMPHHNVTDASAGRYVPEKSLMGIPWRYALGCIDDLGLILRAEVIWSKPNGMPESVTDRVRRSHEQWFHFVKQPRYFSAVDEVREVPLYPTDARHLRGGRRSINPDGSDGGGNTSTCNPLGKLPGSVWTVATEPLNVPAVLGVDHFAAFPTEWPRRIIQGWSPSGVCTACLRGRWPVVTRDRQNTRPLLPAHALHGAHKGDDRRGFSRGETDATITGYACDCPEPTAPTMPGVVLDPFGGTGTTALVAHALGRVGISVDLSHDYSRLAKWRTSDPGELAKAMRVEKPAKPMDGQTDLFGGAA